MPQLSRAAIWVPVRSGEPSPGSPRPEAARGRGAIARGTALARQREDGVCAQFQREETGARREDKVAEGELKE